MSKRPPSLRDGELIAIARQLRAIDRKQASLQALGLGLDSWLQAQALKLHAKRQQRTQAVNEAAARARGWDVGQGSASA